MAKNNDSTWGLPDHPTVWFYGGVIIAAIIVLALLRLLFANIRVTAGKG